MALELKDLRPAPPAAFWAVLDFKIPSRWGRPFRLRQVLPAALGLSFTALKSPLAGARLLAI